MPLAAPAQQGGVTDITLPNGSGALAIQRIVKSLPGQVIVIQERTSSLWRLGRGAVGHAVGDHRASSS